MSIIYGLIDNTLELRYIGKTLRQLELRVAEHMKYRSSNIHLNNWLRIRHVSAIVLENDPEDLDKAERQWITNARVKGMRLLNITDGGTGGNTFSGQSPQAKTARGDKIRAAKLGSKHSAETRVKMSDAKIGNQNALGHICSPEARAKMSAAHRRSML